MCVCGAIPGELVTSYLRNRRQVLRMVDGKVQRFVPRASLSSLAIVMIGAALRVCIVVPCVLIASRSGDGRNLFSRVDGNGLCNLVGTSSSGLHGEGYLIGARLCVGVAGALPVTSLTITEAPLITVNVLSRRRACERHRLVLAHGGGSETGNGLRVDRDCLCNLVRTTSCGLHGERHLIGAWLGVGVAGTLPVTGLVVAKVPLEIVDVLSRRGAGELRRLTLAYGGGSKACIGLRINGDSLCGLV